jgi:hypothetical protein
MKPFDVQNLGIWSLHHVAPLFSPMCFTLNHLSWDVLFQCCRVNQCNPSRLHVDDVAPPSLSVHNTPCQLTIEDCSRSYKVLTTCFYLWGFLTKPLQNLGIMSTRRWDLGPLHTRDWEPVTITIQALSSVEKRFILRLRDQRSMWMQDGCKVYMASDGSCFMVTWTIFKNHLLEICLTQNRETLVIWTLTAVDLFYFIMCEDLHE